MRCVRGDLAALAAIPLAVACLLLAAGSAVAATATIGELAPDPYDYVSNPPYYEYVYHPPAATCTSVRDLAQPTTSYTVPASGKEITSWRTKATMGAGQEMTFKVFRKVADPTTYEVVGHDGPRVLTAAPSANQKGTINNFPGLSIPVQPGDVIGLYTKNSDAVSSACMFSSTGSYLFSNTNLADASSAAFTSSSGYRLNLSAVVQLDTPPGGPSQHTLTVNLAGSGYGTVQSTPLGIESCASSCSQAFNDGTKVSLTAHPDSYSSFGGWSGGCSGTGTCEVTIGSDTTVIATFNAGSYSYDYGPGTYGPAGGGATAGTESTAGPVRVRCKRTKAGKKVGCRKTKLVAKQARNPTLGKKVLTATNGRTLYTLSGESGGRFLCTGSCLSSWPPLKVPAGAQPVGPVKLGAVKRPEGGRQVTYHGHPLYAFAGDSRPGDVNGQGLTTAGGAWSATVLPAGSKRR
jgi:predicted lipoprotein with Yx(FWY)xxD motif